MAKSDYGRDMYRQLTEVMARLEKVEEKSRETDKKKIQSISGVANCFPCWSR